MTAGVLQLGASVLLPMLALVLEATPKRSGNVQLQLLPQLEVDGDG